MALFFIPDLIMPPADIGVHPREPALHEVWAFGSVDCDGAEAGGVALDARGSEGGGCGVFWGRAEGLVGIGWAGRGDLTPGSAGGGLVGEGPHCRGHDAAVLVEGEGVEGVFDACVETKNQSVHKI